MIKLDKKLFAPAAVALSLASCCINTKTPEQFMQEAIKEGLITHVDKPAKSGDSTEKPIIKKAD